MARKPKNNVSIAEKLVLHIHCGLMSVSPSC